MQYFFDVSPFSERNLVILITDHLPDEQAINDSLIELSSHDLRLFPIYLGSETSLQGLEELACDNKGFLIRGPKNNQSYPTVMKDFFAYLTEGLEISNPIWSPAYEDALQFGTIVTVMMPAYDSTPYKRLIGVVGLDVTLNYLEENLAADDIDYAF